MGFVIPATLAILILIFGGIGVYLAEHKQQDANITNLGDTFWQAVIIITTVGYGDYYPVTSAGRILAIVVMFSGIGIVITLIGMLSQRRVQRVVLRIKSKTKVQP